MSPDQALDAWRKADRKVKAEYMRPGFRPTVAGPLESASVKAHWKYIEACEAAGIEPKTSY